MRLHTPLSRYFTLSLMTAFMGLMGLIGVSHAQNVGIGTATPAEKLHILNGSLRIDGGTNPTPCRPPTAPTARS